MSTFSPQMITAIAEVVTGGSGNSTAPSKVGIYRTGTRIEIFFGNCNIEFRLANRSRVSAVLEHLTEINNKPGGALPTLTRIVEAAVDPRDFLDYPERLRETVDYLNKRLRFDGFELREIDERHRMVNIRTEGPAVATLQEKVDVLDLDTVRRDSDRANRHADEDPEDAITAACSMLESVCRSLLREMGKPLPAKKDLSGLVREVQRHLNLSPEREDLPNEIKMDVKQVLGGLTTAAQGIGALRTHAGDAHGKDRGAPRMDGRIARLAIHAASTVSVFFIETWQRRVGAMTTATSR